MLDKIVLGILSLREMTLYEIKKAMDKTVNHFYTTSYGSIHPALVKLESRGAVTSRETVSNGRAKKYYSLSDKGAEEFKQWLTGDITVSRIREDALVKIFFFGLIDPDARERIITHYLREIETVAEELAKLHSLYTQQAAPPQHQEIWGFQLETLLYGIAHTNFLQEWYGQLLQKMQQQEKK